MSSQRRPREHTLTATPAADDIVIVDGDLMGSRALPMTYFDATYAKAATCKLLVAGANVTLTQTDGVTILDFNTT